MLQLQKHLSLLTDKKLSITGFYGNYCALMLFYS